MKVFDLLCEMGPGKVLAGLTTTLCVIRSFSWLVDE